MASMCTQVFGMDVVVTNNRGATYFVPEYAHTRVARRILNGRLAEMGLHQLVRAYFSERQGSMVHAGTFFGDMLPSFARKVPGTLYAFEPVMENYLLAWSTVATNDLENVVLFHAGLGESVGTATMQTQNERGHRGGKSHVEVDGGVEHGEQRVSLLTIDAMGIDDLALLQLDVEGFELPVLRGAATTIERTRPLVVLEDNSDNCGPLLKSLDYDALGTVGPNTVYAPVGAELSAGVLERLK